MESPAKWIAPLLLIGICVTFSSAANITCPSSPLNETTLCATVTGSVNVNDYCSSSFQQYACSNISFLTVLPNDILVTLSNCYTNETIQSLDPIYLSLFLSKLDMNKTTITHAKLNSQFTSFKPEWSKFLVNGIWSLLIQNLNNKAGPPQWIPSSLQPYLIQISTEIAACLQQQQNVTCGIFQELVKNLDLAFPNMTVGKKQELYSGLKSFLSNRQKVSGSACAQNTTSSMWMKQYFARFSQVADIADFTALNPNFTALDVLSSLTIQQIAKFSVAFNTANNSAAISNILAAIWNISPVADFLSYLNAAAISMNISSVQAPFAQVLLNKTFEALRLNISSFNSSDWTQLFQDKLNTVLTEITVDQMSLIPQNISCTSYQAIIKGIDMKFPQMSLAKQHAVFQTFVKPFLDKQGPLCSQNLNSSALINQNLRSFSQFVEYSDLLALNGNFSALNVLPLLTIRQRVNFTLRTSLTADQAFSIVGSLQNSDDVYYFLGQLNDAANMTNQMMLQSALSHALLNKTFDVLKSNFSNWSSLDWSQLFQVKLNLAIAEITPDQLSLINQNISCDSYQTIVTSLDSKFSQMTSITQKAVFQNLIQPYMKNKGSSCNKNGNSIDLLKQNFGKFSMFADYSDIVSSLGNKFNALDVLSSLTTSQLVNLTLNTTMNDSITKSIVGALQSSTDLHNFLSTLNTALSLNNQTYVGPALSKALITKTLTVMQSNFSSFKSSNWTQLFQGELAPFLPNISPDQLNLLPNNLPCDSYQTIVKSLDLSFPQMSTGTQQSVYNTFIKPYLTTKGRSNSIVCYNQSDANSDAWLVTNMGSFLSCTSQGDLMGFANDNMLQKFANDKSCVKLASTLNFSKSTATYYTSLLTSSGQFNISSLPDAFLCSLSSSAMQNLNADASLAFTKKRNKQCYSTSSGQVVSNLTADELQVAMSLVSKITNISSSVISDLGQTAVGLSLGQINKMNGTDLKSSVSSLATVTGWNTGQTRSIINKLLDSNYVITNLTDLGSLVSGLPSDKLLELNAKDVVNAVQNVQFANQLSNAPSALQNAVVQQILTVDSNPSKFVKNVPASLAPFIPSSKLIYKSEKPTLQDVNSKSWTPSQASMFFDNLLSSTSDYTQISASVLQGFTCSTPSQIDNNQLKTLAKAMKKQNAPLNEAQLTCLSRQVTKNGYPADLDQYPDEVFLFLNASNYINSSVGCKDFYAKVGAANVNILQKGSQLRTNLLSRALSCLNVTGFNLTDTNIQTLGNLICDLNATFIVKSPKSLLSNLSQCNSFTSEQQTAIQNVFSSGTSIFGSLSNWTQETLNSLGGMVAYLNQSIISSIPSSYFDLWLKTAVQNSAFSRDQLVTIMKYRTATRSRRDAVCPSDQLITASNVNEPLLPITYTAALLDSCLDSETLLNYLSVLSSKPFTNEQLQILKNKLDQLYPGGYPKNVIINLGAISFLCSSTDISKWNITSVDILSSLLSVGPSDNLAQSIIAQYISSSNQWNGSAINAIGKYICLLNSFQLNLITPSALSDAKTLDISACNQSVKDALYIKANASYQGMTNQTSAYYNLIKPYLGGAPYADLKALSALSPNMDVSTFVQLNPNSVVSLTVSDVQSLLGNNIADLNSQLSSTTVKSWIQNQKQSDLDKLGLGIQGGIRESVTTASTTTTKPYSASPVFLQSLSFVLTAVGVTFLF